MKALLHGLGHVGLVAVGVAAGAGWLAPPPFNFAIGGGAMLAAGVLGAYGVKVVTLPVMKAK